MEIGCYSPESCSLYFLLAHYPIHVALSPIKPSVSARGAECVTRLASSVFPHLRRFSYHMTRQRYVPYPKPEGKNRLLISIRHLHRLCPLLNGTIKQEDGFNNAAFMGAPPTMS